MFGYFFGNLGKSSVESNNKHCDNFPKFLKIFENLRKSSEICGSLQNTSKVFGNLRKKSEMVAKCSRRPSNILIKSSEIVGSLRKSSEVRKRSENKSSEIFGSAQKCSENLGNHRKFFECNRKLVKIFYTLPTSDTCGSRIFICNLHWYYAFCTGVTL